MIGACALPVGAPSLARDILATTDCLITGRIQSAYAALLAPGGTFVQALTIALTIYVAVFGYRLILGYSGLTLGEVVPHFIKIGVVLALATSWSSYQVVVFDLLFHGPEQLANAITGQLSDSPATGQGDVLAALQGLFDRITEYAGNAWAQVSRAVPAVPVAQVTPTPPVAPLVPGAPPPAALAPTQVALPFSLGAAQFVAAALWLAALVMMVASVGVLLVMRIILALLLVLGPVFIACALFAPTRGLFEGWLRTTVKFAAVPLFTLPLTAALVAVLLPFVQQLDAAPIENFRDGPTLAILLIVLVFAAVLFQAVRLAGGIAGGIRLPRGTPLARLGGGVFAMPAQAMAAGTVVGRAGEAGQMITVQSTASNSRGGTAGTNPGGMLVATRSIGTLAPPVAPVVESAARLGQSYRRLTIGTAAGSPARRTGV